MVIITALLTGLLCVAGFVIWNLLRKVEKQEDLVEVYNQYLATLDDMIKASSKRLKEIDAKQVFSSDDEIGWYFAQIKEIQEILDEFKLKR
jgi:hypothetical protein